MFEEKQHYFDCPFCGESISMLLDLSINNQTYIEDCEVCCRPIEISYQVSAGEMVYFIANRSV